MEETQRNKTLKTIDFFFHYTLINTQEAHVNLQALRLQ